MGKTRHVVFSSPLHSLHELGTVLSNNLFVSVPASILPLSPSAARLSPLVSHIPHAPRFNMTAFKSLLAILYIATTNVNAQSSSASASACSSTIAPQYGQPSVAPGWNVQVVASGLTDTRGIIFDSDDHLLVVQRGYGISSLTLTQDDGACVRAEGGPHDVIVDERVSLAPNLLIKTQRSSIVVY